MSIVFMDPKFSVIIAAYNSGATLSNAIDSVLAQSYAASEIIIVDDGSSDDTAAVARHYGDSIRYHFQKNAGVSSARNKGVELAQGDWLAFLDADDWYYPKRLEWHAEIILRIPDVDFLIGDYHYGCQDGSIIKRSIESTAFGRETLAAADEHKNVLLGVTEMGALIPAYFGHTLTMSVPRQKFLALGGYARTFSIAEDTHLFVRLCANSRKAGVTCEPMGVYCIHDSGLIRADVVNSQIKTVETLSSLKPALRNALAPVRQGYLLLLVNARYDLATVLIRRGRHMQAIISFLPSLIESFSWRSLKMLLSIIKG